MSLVAWTLSFLRPHRARVLAITALAGVEVVLGALAPWPLKTVVDNVLGAQPLPGPLAAAAQATIGTKPVTLLLAVVVAGLLLQLVSELVTMLHTQLQVNTGQRILYDLRARLLDHLLALGLRHHIVTRTADSVYRLEADAYCVNDLAIGGIFPLTTAALKLVVMFAILAQLDLALALLALSVVPFLYALPALLLDPHGRPGRARQAARVVAGRAHVRDPVVDPRRQELRPRASRTGALQPRGPRHHGGAAAPDLAGVVLRRGLERHHAGRHRARAHRRRPARARWPPHRRRAARGAGLSGRRLQPAVVDRPHDRLAAAGRRERPARARDLRDHARTTRRD